MSNDEFTKSATRFRKKPVVVEAVQYAGMGNLHGTNGGVPEWMWEAFERGTLKATDGRDPLVIATLEGRMVVSPGDWIIRGVIGELYACKPDIFALTYEPESVASQSALIDPDAAAKALFAKNAEGYRNATPWDELHEDTRQLWRDEAAKRTRSSIAPTDDEIKTALVNYEAAVYEVEEGNIDQRRTELLAVLRRCKDARPAESATRCGMCGEAVAMPVRNCAAPNCPNRSDSATKT